MPRLEREVRAAVFIVIVRRELGRWSPRSPLPMTRWILLAVLIVAVTATATVVVQSLPASSSVGRPQFPVAEKQGPVPKVVVDGELRYQFGTKAQQSTFAKDWVIKNEGDADLQLRLEAPPCSCTVAGFQTDDGLVTGTT